MRELSGVVYYCIVVAVFHLAVTDIESLRVTFPAICHFPQTSIARVYKFSAGPLKNAQVVQNEQPPSNSRRTRSLGAPIKDAKPEFHHLDV